MNEEKEKKDNKAYSMQVDHSLIEKLSSEMKIILEEELAAGNEISETCRGGFSQVSDDHIFVFLKYPFRTPGRDDIEGITYREINDRHYWKAEYDDERNGQTIACSF